MDSIDTGRACVSVPTIGEIRKGIEKIPYSGCKATTSGLAE
ncbi:MAG: hypothetical protein ABSG35_05275 [Syntrophobacteraceae bacterium]|jgi:hypothetical protein